MTHDDRELQELILGLKAVDEDVTTEAMAAYPSFIASLPLNKLRLLAVRGAMHAVEMAYQLDRHSPQVESFLQHIILDVTPAAYQGSRPRLAN